MTCPRKTLLGEAGGSLAIQTRRSRMKILRSDFEQILRSCLGEDCWGDPATVPNVNLGDLRTEFQTESQKQTNSPNGRFVTHSIDGSYGGGSICPKTGHTAYGSLWKLSEIKCFRLNYIPPIARSLLILVVLGCFDRYKIDYSNHVLAWSFH